MSKFNVFIEKNVCNYVTKLEEMFTFKDWKELASFTLTSVQLFNRKRAGEIERITIEDFKTCQEINENQLETFHSSQDKPSTSNQRYVRFLIPKKNPYVFGIPGNSTVHTHLNACQLMRRFSLESDIRNPELVRGTYLIKHLATQAAYLDLDDTEVGDLANFMGHAEKIHRDHYSIPITSREVQRVSGVLEFGIGNYLFKYILSI